MSQNHNAIQFEKTFVVSLALRTDRRDGMILAAALSDIEFECIDGVDGAFIPDQALPQFSASDNPSKPVIGPW